MTHRPITILQQMLGAAGRLGKPVYTRGLKAPEAGRLTKAALRGNLVNIGPLSPARQRVFRNASSAINTKVDP